MQESIKLRGFSTAQLIEELARRSNERGKQKPRDWCDDCVHFIPWVDGKTPESSMLDDYNPCEKNHVMRFHAPEEIGEEFGHYRTVCVDRQPREKDINHE